MANFCRQCSIDTFGEDFEDLKGFTTESDSKNGFFVDVLCEGCGATRVDHLGECISEICLKEHGRAKRIY
jgi:hypothetical protein